MTCADTVEKSILVTNMIRINRFIIEFLPNVRDLDPAAPLERTALIA